MDKDSINYRLRYLNTRILSDDVANKFMRLKTHEEQFILVLETIIKSSDVLFDFHCKRKLSEHSKICRETGNQSYLASQYFQALQEYTESVVYAVDSSEEQALAYANRSAALFKLEKYEECIDDIDRALHLKYPEKLKSKLYKRKGLCLVKLSRPGADSAFQKALMLLDKTTLSKDELNKNESELRDLISILRPVVELPQNGIKHALPEIHTPNPEIPGASDAVEVKYSKQYGRHIVATRKIRPGEILVREKPFCRRLVPKHVYTNCAHCLCASWAMIPCKYCVNVAYCSEACKDKAWDKYHEVECPVNGFLLGLNTDDPTCLTMRMAIIATKKGTQLAALREELIIVEQNSDPCTSLYSDDGKLHSDQYRSIHCSQLQEYEQAVPIEKLLSAAVWVAVAVYCLARKSKMFGEKLTLDTLAKNPDVIFVGGLMYKHLHLGAHIKTHKISSSNGPVPVEYGQSLMTIGSLFNHSCDPNTARQWILDEMMVVAVYPIEKGEQLFDNYNALNFTVMTKSQRQENFKRWKFSCKCLPCTENWPMLWEIPSYKMQKLTPQRKKKIMTAVQKFTKCKSLIPKGTTDNEPNTLNELAEMIEVLSTYARKPCRELILGNHLMQLYWAANETVLDYEPMSEDAAGMPTELLFSNLKQILLET